MSVDPSAAQVIAYTDPLSPNAVTWKRDTWAPIDVGPVEPRIRDLVIRGYREMLDLSTYLGDAVGREKCIRELAKLGAQP